MNDDVLITVDSVSKKFCRRLKRSLWYGLKDIGADLRGASASASLREEEFWAVDDVSFDVRRGTALGLIGRNGAGKTTLLKLLNGLIRPDVGRLELKGRVGALIALGAGFHPLLTGRENIYINGAVLGLKKREIDQKFDDIVAFAGIEEFIDMPVRSYSTGMQVRLGFSVASSLNPDILLVDEVLAVGDVPFRMQCYQRILDCIDHGTTVILVSHNKMDLERVCTEGLLMTNGRLHYKGDLYEALSLYSRLSINQENVDSETKSIRFIEPRPFPVKLITGDELNFSVKIESKVKVRDCRLVWHLDAPGHGRLSSLSSRYSGIRFDLQAGVTEIQIRLPNVPLLRGTYYFQFDAYGPTVESHLAASPFYEIHVTGPPTDSFGYGACHIIDFGLQWNLSNATTSNGNHYKDVAPSA